MPATIIVVPFIDRLSRSRPSEPTLLASLVGMTCGRSRRSILWKKEGVSQPHADTFVGQLDQLVPVVPVPAIGADAAQFSRFRDWDDPVQLDHAEVGRLRLVEMPSARR